MAKWVVWMLLFLLIGCSSPNVPDGQGVAQVPDAKNVGEEEKAGTDSWRMRDKDKITREMEKCMRLFLGEAIDRFDDIHARYQEELAGLEVPPKIEAVEMELSEFYSDREERYKARVKAIVQRFSKEMDETLGFLKPKVWDIAFELVGSKDLGTGYDSRTGIDEVDDSAEATLELLEFRSRRDDIFDYGERAETERVSMDRIYKNDLEGVGRFSIYASDPMNDFFRKNEDAVAVTVAFQKKGLALEVPVGFRQLVRERIVRGGSTCFDSGFKWDETLGNVKGSMILEIRAGMPEVVVSKVFYPRIDMDYPDFEKFNDFTAVRDYKTAAIDTSTGEILECVSWQYKWSISHFGSVSVAKGAPAVRDENSEVMKAALSQDAEAEGSQEQEPSEGGGSLSS